ncbi:MAG: tetratricopeptide repeat protein, partial [Fibrobacterota bacterium]
YCAFRDSIKREKIIKESYSEIPMYFHDKGRANKKAERQTDPEMLTKAVEWYRKYNNRYSDEKWRVYKNRYLIAECYYEMRRYREAATEFDWLATVDLGTYPPREKEKKLTHEKGQPSDTSKTEEAMITQEECGYNAVFCYRKLSEIAVAKSGLDQKESFSLPEVKAYLAYVDKFARLFPDSKHVPAFLYASAVTLFTAEQWPQAAGRFENIMQEYPDASTEEGSLAKRAERMLAKSQVQMGNFAEAVGTFKSALSKLEKDTELYAEVKKSVEGAMFKEAEQLRSQGRYVESANTFLAILRDYPDSDIGDKILFEAAASFEQGSKFKEAAVTFEQVMTRYKESGLAIRALLRSADAYKKLRDFISAAKMFEKVTKSFPQDKEAVPSLFRAATAYDSAGEMILAARTLESVAAKYPKSSEAPGALYTAGLKYEKGEMYKDAINVYEKLRKDFQNSNYTIEAVFSVALNYENLKDDKGIAKAYENFIEFSENSGETDFNKLSSSCIKAAKAYLRLGNTRRAELMYNKAIGIYKEYGKKHLIDPAFPAEAHFYFADQYYEDYADIKLAGRSSKTVARQMKKKLKAIEKPIKEYAAIISLQTDKYTTKATFMCGKIFYNLADAIKHQSVNEKNPFKKAYAQMKINETVPQYLAKGQEYFYTNIHKFGIEMGVNDEWVKKSGELFMQGEYLKGYLFEESAEIIDAAPIPKGMSAEEKEAYKYEIEDIVLQLQDKAVPAYEVGLKNAKDLFLRDSQYEYTAKIRKRLAALRPANEALQIVIGAKPTPTKEKSTKDRMDINLKRALAAIEEIVNSSELSFSDKREKLNAIERTARGNMERERIKIKNLKEEIESVQNKIEEILK